MKFTHSSEKQKTGKLNGHSNNANQTLNFLTKGGIYVCR